MWWGWAGSSVEMETVKICGRGRGRVRIRGYSVLGVGIGGKQLGSLVGTRRRPCWVGWGEGPPVGRSGDGWAIVDG